MDTRDTRFQNLLFLLSAAPIGLACVITDDGGTDTEAATENPTTGTPSTTTEAETDTPMTTGMTSSTGPVADSGSSDTGPVADSGTAGSTGPEPTTGGDVPPACAAYGDAVTLCYDAEAGAAAASYCAEAFANYEMNYGAECVSAFEDWLACLSALTCEELTGADPVCADQSGVLETACAAQ